MTQRHVVGGVQEFGSLLREHRTEVASKARAAAEAERRVGNPELLKFWSLGRLRMSGTFKDIKRYSALQ